MVGQLDLEKPLDPALQYFDATPSIEEIARQMAQLLEFIALQLSINASIAEHVKELRERLSALEEPKSGLILPKRLAN